MSSIEHEFRLERLILEKPADLRYKVYYNQEWPYSNIGIIKTPYIVGTGILVSPNIILTCAHIVYYTTIPSKIHFFCPSFNESRFTKFAANNYFIPKNFQIDDPQPNANDWALIYVESESSQSFPLKKLKPVEFKILEAHRNKYPILLVGYPGDKNGDLYEACGEIFEFFKEHFSYKLDTTTGQSGSPILARIEGNLYLVGIHQSSDLFIEKKDGSIVGKYTNKNWGIRINQEIIQQIKNFKQKEESRMRTLNDAIRNERRINKGVITKKKKDGYGLIYFEDGSKYIGHLNEDLDFHGRGLYSWKEGEYIEGNFFKGSVHGLVIYHWKDSRAEESIEKFF